MHTKTPPQQFDPGTHPTDRFHPVQGDLGSYQSSPATTAWRSAQRPRARPHGSLAKLAESCIRTRPWASVDK